MRTSSQDAAWTACMEKASESRTRPRIHPLRLRRMRNLQVRTGERRLCRRGLHGPAPILRHPCANSRRRRNDHSRMTSGTSPADPAAPTRFRLGDWLVDATNHELVAAGGRVRLQPRQMQLLLRLAREPDTLLRREQLLGDVWEGRYVNDEALSRAIAELRQLLADDPRAPKYIETVPRLGYRLIARPEPEATAAPTGTAADGASSGDAAA